MKNLSSKVIILNVTFGILKEHGFYKVLSQTLFNIYLIYQTINIFVLMCKITVKIFEKKAKEKKANIFILGFH